MRTKRASKTLSLFLAMCMVFTMLPTVAFAETSDMGPSAPLGVSTITAFAELDTAVYAQGVEVGTTKENLVLPDRLVVTVVTDSATTATDSDAQKEAVETTVDVSSWISDPEYDGDTAGVYTFTPSLTLSEGLTVAEGVSPPTITATVTTPDALAPRGAVQLMSTGSVTGTMDIGEQTSVGFDADTEGTGWTWTASTSTLTLNSSYQGGYIKFKCADTDTINLLCNGTVTVNKGDAYAIQCWGSLVISGGPLVLKGGLNASKDIVILGTMGNINGGIDAGGSVTISGRVGDITSTIHTIYAHGDITISDGAVVGKIGAGGTGSSSSTHGIYSNNGGVVINGTTGDISGTYYGIYAKGGSVTINGTTGAISSALVSTSDYSGIRANSRVVINGTTGAISSASNYGILAESSDVLISGITGDITGTKVNGIYAAVSGITISPSAVVGNIAGAQRGIDAYGDVTIGGKTGDITGVEGSIFGGGIEAGGSVTIPGETGDITSTNASIPAIGAGGDVSIIGSVGKIAVTASSGGGGLGIYAGGGIHIINSVTISSFNGAFNKGPATLPSSYTATWSDNVGGSGSSTGSTYTWNASHQYVKIENGSGGGAPAPTVSGFRAERNGANNVKFYFTPSTTGKYGYEILKKGETLFSLPFYFNITSVEEFENDATISGILASDILVIYLQTQDTAGLESQIYSLEVAAYTDAHTPNINSGPLGNTYMQNAVATSLHVNASTTDNGTLSYQWYSNSTNSTVGGTEVGTNSYTYTPSTATVGTTYYYCVVTNTNNEATTNKTATATSDVAAITVTAPPAPTITITKQPQNVTVTQGRINETLIVEAVASNGKPVRYQWRQFIGGIGSDNTQPMLGATSSTFTIPTGLPAGTYRYLCVFNTDGTDYVDSNTAIVTVKPPSSGGNGGGSYGGGSGGGGSYTPPPVTTPPQAPPNQPVIASTPVIATVGTNGTAYANIPASAISDAITRAQAAARAQGSSANGISVGLNVTMPQGATSLTAAIPQSALQSLVTAGVNQFAVNGAPVSLGLNRSALQSIQRQASGGITIGMTPATGLSASAQSMIGDRPVYNIIISYTDKNGKAQNITSFDSGTATLAFPYTPGRNEALDYLFGVYVDGSGNASRIPGSVYDANSRSILIPTNHLSVYGVGYTAPSAKFTDIASHWAKESINYVVGRGLLSGTSETTFAPNTDMTRGMLVTALGRLAGMDVKAYTKNSFTDVKADSPFRPYIEWAYSKGIIMGIGNNQFAADRAITREEIAVIFANYAKATGYKLPVIRTTAAAFADASSIGGTYKDAVTAMQQAGIMMGEQNNKFNPKQSATRAEVSSMLHRYIKLTIDPATAQGWAKNDDGQYMYYKNGKALTGTQTIDGVKYFFNTDDTLKTCWVKDGDNWRYYSGNKAAMGWLYISDKRYYFTKDGLMVSGKWLELDGKWYYFNADGSLAKNTKVDGYEVNENGVRKSK